MVTISNTFPESANRNQGNFFQCFPDLWKRGEGRMRKREENKGAPEKC